VLVASVWYNVPHTLFAALACHVILDKLETRTEGVFETSSSISEQRSDEVVESRRCFESHWSLKFLGNANSTLESWIRRGPLV
jgi:hypothetical protein